ncbi:hypothetical protein N792_03930 [Lysobacter concretionis Ko07 = DSM 16239]|uniref:Uncharacterized protein n=1 Tax=Lysobacter concretionis Ko07 = DSM 16239 TaxID=1122185 RepID=A0A0A0EMR4_9GAMM|nr:MULTISPECIES: hypothetical protein [Lysobacter]KGM52271.1 hypothetical protein N792_03930 [Lysobacter concretionis Ko07 = DSM 16239]QOD91997.1 hypothetical protein H2514_05050 [Lysobacter sp. CW239]
MRHNPLPKKKSKLPPLGKALIAAKVLLEVRDEKLDGKEAGALLRREVGLQWTVLTAAQYLTGKEAMGALDSLAAHWSDGDWTKRQMVEAVLFANLFCAQAHPKGSAMSAGTLVPAFKPGGEFGNLLQELQARADGLVPDAKPHRSCR